MNLKKLLKVWHARRRILRDNAKQPDHPGGTYRVRCEAKMSALDDCIAELKESILEGAIMAKPVVAPAVRLSNVKLVDDTLCKLSRLLVARMQTLRETKLRFNRVRGFVHRNHRCCLQIELAGPGDSVKLGEIREASAQLERDMAAEIPVQLAGWTFRFTDGLTQEIEAISPRKRV